MEQPTPKMLRLLRKAAGWRAAAIPWKQIAEKMRQDVKTCRRWPRLHADLWRESIARARRRVKRKGDAEARTFLRLLLRTGNERTKLGAASLLLISESSKSAKTQSISPEVRELAAYISELKGQTDEQLQQLVAGRASPRGGGNVAEDQPGTQRSE